MICVSIEDRNQVKLPKGAIASDLLSLLKMTSPLSGASVKINSVVSDWSTPLQDGDVVKLLDFDDEEGRKVFWHTTAHVLAQAILRLWPQAQPTIGPPIENGFYYDFANLQISETDFPRIEQEMERICKEGHHPERRLFSSKQEALDFFRHQPYKCELIESFSENQPLTGYQQGEFFDLCRGPHLPVISKIRAFKLLKTAGAYWRGDAKAAMLTRIYAISFPDPKDLRAYLHRMEEAKKRDHKILGPKLDLFSMREEAPGIPLFHPAGVEIWHRLLSYWRELHRREGYNEIKTPLLLSKELWEQSGHWDHYRENMFLTAADERKLALKPMNCPGAFLYFKQQMRSYRQLPLKIAEIGHVHRNEASGALSGLMRARGFHQDDAHIFLAIEQVEDQVAQLLKLTGEIYQTFGLEYQLELSTRPTGPTIGTDQEWEQSTNALKGALTRFGSSWRINEGDGAFYGPKIDVHVRDAIGRTWQCATIQLDLCQSKRFDLGYTSATGQKVQPVILHRVIFGSIERFLAILIEHFAGRFPLWLSPRAVRLAPVADRHRPLAEKICAQLRESGFPSDVDMSGESISKMVRAAQLDQVNYILVIGDQEEQKGTLSVRARSGKSKQLPSLQALLQLLLKEQKTRALTSFFDE